LEILLNAALSIIKALTEYLSEEDNLNDLIDAAVDIIVTLADFLAENVDLLFDAAGAIIVALVSYFSNLENLKKIGNAGLAILKALGKALVSSVSALDDGISEAIDYIADEFFNLDLSEAGKEAITSWFKGMALAFTSTMNGPLGSALSQIGAVKDLIDGFEGFSIDGSHRSGLDYVPYDGYIAELHKGERVLTAAEARGYSSGNSFGDIIINIEASGVDDVQSLAQEVAYEIQNLMERREAVYA
jgi:hypothetical protein